MPLELAPLEARLATLFLSTTETPASTGTALNTYFFRPKSGSKHPINETVELTLVIVAVEQGKDVGSAAAVAKKVGIKDMRSIAGDQVLNLIGRTREQASVLSLPPSIAPTTLILTSSTLASHTLLVPSPTNPAETIQLSAAEWTRVIAGLESEGAAVKEVEFVVKVEGVPGVAAPVVKKEKAPAPPKKDQSKPNFDGVSGVQLGITVTKNKNDFAEWYSQTLVKGEMLDYYDISGCYILKPASYGIWQEIQNWFDAGIKALGVQNAYFPMFVSAKVLEREKDHIEGFAPEVAWVTRAGQSDLEEPIAIRPTSETVMYPYYSKWIRSHRDLPLKLNQWNSVVRWEFKNPQPFLRTREFLWQEGHTAFLTKPEADEEVLQILDLYRRVYEELLAVPVVPGVKSEKEKFAGGLYTTTVEGFIPTTGRGIQGGTSHCLGQNFSKMFNIAVESPILSASGEREKTFVWQNSWGLSTRTIGVMVMTHGDDKGLVIPPRVAQLQVVIVPTGLSTKTDTATTELLYDEAHRIAKELIKVGVKVKADTRSDQSPPFKYNEWETKGVCIRLELGPRDLAAGTTVSVRRDNGVKASLDIATLATSIPALLEQIQADMLAKARKTFDDHRKIVTEWKDFVPTLNSNCVVIMPWCEVEACEDAIKERSAKETSDEIEDVKAPSSGAKSLCIPHDQAAYPALTPTTCCPACGTKATRWTLFGRSY